MQPSPTLNLSPAQTQVIAALASGETVTGAARAAGVHRSTVHNWLADPAFSTEFDRIREDAAARIAEEIAALERLALTTLRSILEDPKASPSVRLRAALAVLNRKPPVPHAAPVREEPVPRNAPCPCGSGQKYKRCCGHNAPPLLHFT